MNQHMREPLQTGEIDLVNLLVALLRHKWYFIVPFILLVLLGITAAILPTPKYTYSAVVQIGQVAQPGQSSAIPIEDPRAVISKIRSALIPEILSEYRIAHPDDPKDYKIDVSSPDNSNVVVISVNGTSAQEPLLAGFLNEIVGKLIEDDSKRFESAISLLQSQLVLAQNRIASLKDEITLATLEINGTDVEIKRTSDEIAQVRKNIEETAQSRDSMMKGQSSGDTSFALLLLNNELTEMRGTLFKLINRLDVDLPEKRTALQAQIKSLGRQIDDQQGSVSELKSQVDATINTHAVAPPIKSLSPIGLGAVVVIGLAIAAGILFGLISVFIGVLGKVTKERLFNAE